MPCCFQCGRPVAGDRAYCPACLPEPAEGNVAEGALAAAASRPSARVAAEPPEAGPAERGFVAIARFRNAAEAGYFADELTRAGDFSALVDLEEALDSFGHYWTTRFVLWVPRDEAEAATSELQRLVEATEAEDVFAPSAANDSPPRSDHEREEIAPSESGVNWVPIVLTIAAGSVALWMARSMNEQPKRDVRLAPMGGQQLDLWDRMTDDPEPWVQRTRDGRRELSLSRDGEAALLREDLDGDGIFERVVRIRRSVPAF